MIEGKLDTTIFEWVKAYKILSVEDIHALFGRDLEPTSVKGQKRRIIRALYRLESDGKLIRKGTRDAFWLLSAQQLQKEFMKKQGSQS